ncbi:MAG: deoxyribodipyrimidine photolyase, partial [Deinococcus sp.]
SQGLAQSLGLMEGLDLSDPEALLARLGTDTSVSPGAERGGSVAGRTRLREFVEGHLGRYDGERNDPNAGVASRLSAYLHYGHLSPLRVALEARAHPEHAAFLEELVVRRELSLNFCEYNPAYDRYQGLPTWARATLEKHAADPRAHLYTREQFEASATHDPAWNAANTEMVRTGRMANYMRIYWGKKVLEWSASPPEAYDTLLRLNNKYFLDGRNPNSYTNVAWIFGQHDRPWGERPVYGTVRSVSETGLRRKFDLDAYIRRWS